MGSPKRMLVDAHCYDLACHFMRDKKWRSEDKQELAEAIQRLCEDTVRESDADEFEEDGNSDHA